MDDLRAISQERRAANRESSAAMLGGAGIAFEMKNDGAHLIVRHGGVVADFWPGTGKFNIRGSLGSDGKLRYERGVRLLIKRLRGVPRG